MVDDRKRFSCSEYKKRAKDKEYKESKVLNKIPKLSTFFKPAIPSSLNASDNGQQHDLEKIDDKETAKCESNFVINNLTRNCFEIRTRNQLLAKYFKKNSCYCTFFSNSRVTTAEKQ